MDAGEALPPAPVMPALNEPTSFGESTLSANTVESREARDMQTGWPHRLRWSVVLLCAAIAVPVCLLVFRAVALNSPLMPGDEFAYHISAQYFPRQDIPHQLDPQLQTVDNRVFFAIESLWRWVGPRKFAIVGKLFNVWVYCLGGIVLFGLFWRTFDRKTAFQSVVVYLFLPMSIYTAMELPEVQFQCAFYLLAFALCLLWPRRPFVGALTAAGITASAQMIKPHAIVWVAAVVMLMLASPLLRLSTRCAWRTALAASCTYLGTWYLTVIVLWRITGGEWEYRLRTLVGAFYGGYLDQATDASFWLQHFSSIGIYAFAHGAVLVMMFPLSVVGLVAFFKHSPKSGGKRDSQMIMALFVVVALALVVLMIANFTSSVSLASVGEANRIHGRYLEFILPFLVAFLIFSAKTVPLNRIRLSGVIGLASSIVFAWIIVPRFNIWPWDYPELFAFYRYPNHYLWNYASGQNPLGYAVLVMIMAASALVIAWPHIGRRAFMISLCVVVLAGQIQVNGWAIAQSRALDEPIHNATALAQLLAPLKDGEGAIVVSDRYGQMAAVLEGFPKAQHVMVRPVGAPLGREELPTEIRWVLTTDRYDVHFSYRTSIAAGALTLYQLRDKIPITWEIGKPR